jgi:hypothetical protein
MPRIVFAAFLVAISGAGVACSSSDDGGSRPTKQVKDKLGRTCTIGDTLTASCDQEPKPAAGCKTTATACFTVGTSGDASGPAAICAGCCEGNTSTSVRTDCAAITCATAADCPTEYGRCLNAECRH